MNKFRSVLSHITVGLALAVAVILVIDMFFNSAMCFAESMQFKYIVLALCACAAAIACLNRK